jgi:HD-GYP domain-containing protein (c-di-GMP phosphodiesterase class II)
VYRRAVVEENLLRMAVTVIDLKYPLARGHSQRVSEYAVRLARKMGLPKAEIERIR